MSQVKEESLERHTSQLPPTSVERSWVATWIKISKPSMKSEPSLWERVTLSRSWEVSWREEKVKYKLYTERNGAFMLKKSQKRRPMVNTFYYYLNMMWYRTTSIDSSSSLKLCDNSVQAWQEQKGNLGEKEESC